MWWVLGALVLVLALWQGDGDPVDGAVTVLNEIERGRRATHAKYNAAGVVDVEPQQLADQAGVDLETYALARMISSEEGGTDNTTKAAVGWCCVNEAKRRGTSVAQLLLHAVNPDHSGYFGTQKDIDGASANKGHSDRYASTALDPYQIEIDVAGGIYDGTISDLTDGAQQFDREAGEAHPEKVYATRVTAGAEQVNVPGADPGLRFWRT